MIFWILLSAHGQELVLKHSPSRGFQSSPLSKKHVQNYRSLSSDLWAPSHGDGREMSTGGSHDSAENNLLDLQTVAVQMVMLRLDALMG